MRELDRITKLFRLLVDTYSRPVPLATLQERLDGASSATVKRDIAFLRDSLFIPVVYDRNLNGYYIRDTVSTERTGYSVPGLWVSGDEAYAFLTMFNVMRDIDPGVLTELIAPLRKVLKQVLIDSQVRTFDFDRKICVELDLPACDDKKALRVLSYALANDDVVSLKFKEGASFSDGRYFPQRLILRATGWTLRAVFLRESNESIEIPIQQIALCESIESCEKKLSRVPFPSRQ